MSFVYGRYQVRLLFLALISGLSVGCAEYTKCEYEPHVFPLDEQNELVISTFASGYPEITERIPFLYKKMRAPQSVNFQFFVRAAGTQGGANPNIKSIEVKSLTYEFPGQTPVVLMKNSNLGFWQQGRVQYNSADIKPVPCFEGWYVLLKFDLILNGERYQGEHSLDAASVSKSYPLINEVLR